MNISEVAEKTGLSAHTIRFYEKTGLLPKINRTEGGVRHFTDSDVNFIKFIVSLRKTGMSLEDIAAFTEDGCILERLNARVIPSESVSRRLEILKQHQALLLEQRKEIDMLLDAVHQKINVYADYLEPSAGSKQYVTM